MVLHCLRAADEGGENALMDPEIAYIRLRDENPDFIAALMHHRAMTIPANQGDRPGPVFAVDPATGALHMRYTARARHIVWRDDPATRAAVAFLTGILAGDGPLRFRLSPGQGLIANNVLHNRTGFSDNAEIGRARLLYRARYLDRIAGTAPADFMKATTYSKPGS
jgi:alpha-ketoglutarate-dependent taurine dioxygenase